MVRGRSDGRQPGGTQADSIQPERASGQADSNTPPRLPELDRLVHEPARLMILAHLHVVEHADFLFLMRQTGLTNGNLSSHLAKLDAAGYVEVNKHFVGRKPHTVLKITPKGRDALLEYQRSIRRVLDDLPG